MLPFCAEALTDLVPFVKISQAGRPVSYHQIYLAGRHRTIFKPFQRGSIYVLAVLSTTSDCQADRC
jgi:hypothetical protein